VTAFGRRVQVRVESVDGAGVDVACPDGALVPGMPVTVRVATGGGVAFVQLGVERIESTGAWAHARLRASAVLSVDAVERCPDLRVRWSEPAEVPQLGFDPVWALPVHGGDVEKVANLPSHYSAALLHRPIEATPASTQL
jgi:hypothetical protein